MTRRSFIDAALKAAAGFAILPGATTYARAWRFERKPALAWGMTLRDGTTVEQWFRRTDPPQ